MAMESQLVRKMLDLLRYRGTDVHLDTLSFFRADRLPRSSIDARQWKWKSVRVAHPLKSYPECVAAGCSLPTNLGLGPRGAQPCGCPISPSRQQRQHYRRTLGTLEPNIIRPVTLERNLTHFNLWSDHLSQAIGYWPAGPETYDQFLSEYLELLWDTGEPRTVASYTLSSNPLLSACIAQKAAKILALIWERLELPNQAEPWSESQMVSVAGCFLHNNQFHLAAACIAGFTCLLHTGELLSLKVCDCTFTTHGCVLNLGETKGAKRKQLIDESVLLISWLLFPFPVSHSLAYHEA